MAITCNDSGIDKVVYNGTEFKKVLFNGKMAFWKPTIKWKTTAYAWAGTKTVNVIFEPPPPVDVTVTLTMGNGNNGNVWTTTTKTLKGSDSDSSYLTISSSTTGLYATVVAQIRADVLDGEVIEGNANLQNGAIRAYRIGDNKSGTMKADLTF